MTNQLEVYNAIKARLLTADPDLTTPVKMVDWSNGQADQLEGGGDGLDGYEFPLALIRFEPVQWLALGRKSYEADAVVYVDIIQPGTDRLVSDAGTGERSTAEAILTNVQTTETALDGLRGNRFGPLMVAMNEVDHAYKHIRLDTLGFRHRWYKSNNTTETIKPDNDLAETQEVVDELP